MSYYNDKDKAKFMKCTKLISRGVTGSSSDKYAKGLILDIDIHNINVTTYTTDDIVGISVNGARANRVSFDRHLVDLAIKANVKYFITDNLYNRNRSFNVGEREVAEYLTANNYTFNDHVKGGYWSIV